MADEQTSKLSVSMSSQQASTSGSSLPQAARTSENAEHDAALTEALETLTYSRESFVQVLADPQLYAHLKQVLVSAGGSAEKNSPFVKPILSFIGGFWKLQEVLAGVRTGTGAGASGKGPADKSANNSPPKPPLSHPVLRDFLKGASKPQASLLSGSGESAAYAPQEHRMVDEPDGMIVAPPWLATQMLRFYATYLAPGSPEDIRCISLKTREVVADSLFDLVTSRKVSSYAFSPAASELIELLYVAYYPVFLSHVGAYMPEPKVMQVASETAGAAMRMVVQVVFPPPPLKPGLTSHQRQPSSELSESSRAGSAATGRSKSGKDEKESDKKGFSGFFSKLAKKITKDDVGEAQVKQQQQLLMMLQEPTQPVLETIELRYAREVMVRVLQLSHYYREFAQFVKNAHCNENIMFYEAFMKLEGRIVGSVYEKLEDSPCIDRFLRAESAETSGRDGIVPAVFVPIVHLFYAMFIPAGSPNEVNLTHSMRKTILGEVSSKSIRAGVFDGAINHVLILLYENSFRNYVMSKEGAQ